MLDTLAARDSARIGSTIHLSDAGPSSSPAQAWATIAGR